MSSIIVSGPVPANSAFYVERDLDTIIRNFILNKEYVNLLGGKQTGKTSLIFRIQSNLEAQGYPATYINLQLLDRTKNSQDWYQDLADTFIESLNFSDGLSNLPNVIDASSFRSFIYTIAKTLAGEKLLVVFMDEVQSVPENLREALFNTIRAMFNERSAPRPPQGADKIVFVFAGTFDPDQLIASENSPFNVAQHCYFTPYDFTSEQIYALAEMLNLSEYANEIYKWSAGHPYLTNALLKKIASGSTVQDAVTQTLNDDYHLVHLSRELSKDGDDVLNKAIAIANGKQRPTYTLTNSLVRKLTIIGLIKNDGDDKAVVRCPIYKNFLQDLAEPHSALPIVQSVSQPSLLSFISQADYRTYLESVLVTSEAILEKQPYISLVCAGIVVEGVLIEELQNNVASASLSNAVTVYNRKREPKYQIKSVTLPSDWTFHQMIDIAEAVGIFDKQVSTMTHTLRDWRNFVHPAKALSTLNDAAIFEKARVSISATQYVIAEIRKRHPTT